jgi:peptidoglycan/xylan/chitin deacetylase (PgdA/CDA1 family)
MLIVTYHAIASPASPVAVPLARLERDLDALADRGYAFVTLDAVSSTAVPERAVAVTFDDGYASVATEAWPALARRGLPATVFVIGGRIGLDNRWAGQAGWVPPMPLLDAHALRELAAAGACIGSHSWTHARLTALGDEALAEEVGASADRISQDVQAPVRHFAYPYGARGPREIAAARGRYRTAAGTACRAVDARTDPHDLGRLDAHDLHVAIGLGLPGTAWLRPYLAVRRALRAVR